MDKQQVMQIRREVRKNGLNQTFIEEEAVDFIACSIQKEMTNGLTFSEALQNVMQRAEDQGMFKLKSSLENNRSTYQLNMIQNYLKIARRNFQRHKANTLVNFVGLLLGLFSVVVIGLYVQYEFSYDDFHHDADRVFRINTVDESMGEPMHIGNTSALLRPAIQEELPQVEQIVSLRSIYNNEPLQINGKFYSDYQVTSAQQDFFEIFNFPLVQGSREALF